MFIPTGPSSGHSNEDNDDIFYRASEIFFGWTLLSVAVLATCAFFYMIDVFPFWPVCLFLPCISIGIIHGGIYAIVKHVKNRKKLGKGR